MRFSLVPCRSRRWRRAVLFRMAAVLLGLLPFVVLELSLRALNIGRPQQHRDPFVGFSTVRPLFELNEAGDRFEIAPSRQSNFFADLFDVKKDPREFRIFCIGDSTVQGNPWEPVTSFTAWLEISLNSADPRRHWKVVNCGGISYASYRMVPILEEVLRYQPDLLIVHCSHNEFLEDRTYAALKRTPRWLWRLHERVSQLRSYNVLRTSSRHWAANPERPLTPATDGRAEAPPRTTLNAEVQALLDYRGGVEFYHRDEVWQRGVIAHYEFNLRRMIELARGAGVPLILLNPACNLRESPPFKTEHRAGLTKSELQSWDELWQQARRHYGQRNADAVPLLRAALAIDDQHAGLHYDLAKCLDALGQFEQARAEYVLAKDLDICPLRILRSMNEIVEQVGRDSGTTVVDVRAMFDRLCRDGIPGGDWFADHVHPTIAGYQRIADELADEMVRRETVQPQSDWQEIKRQRYAEHLDSLPAQYFLRGQQRLAALMVWAQGRITRERPAESTKQSAGQSAQPADSPVGSP